MSDMSIWQLCRVDGTGPLNDNSGLQTVGVDPADSYYTPEVQPYRGFTQQYAYVNIMGTEITGYHLDPAALNGPQENSLVILWLTIRDGYIEQVGEWEQIGAARGQSRYPYLVTGNAIPGIGGWTRFVTIDSGPGGPKILGYYRRITALESQSHVSWRIRTSTSNQQCFSQVRFWAIDEQYYKWPVVPTVNARALVQTRAFSCPGVRTTSSPGFYSPVNPGGNMVMTVSIIWGNADTGQPVVLTPTSIAGEEYGFWAYHTPILPYVWGAFFGWTSGLPDNTLIPDGPMSYIPANKPSINYTAVTISLPSNPNVDLTFSDTPLNTFQNLFDTNNLNSFFTVGGSGTPTIG